MALALGLCAYVRSSAEVRFRYLDTASEHYVTDVSDGGAIVTGKGRLITNLSPFTPSSAFIWTADTGYCYLPALATNAVFFGPENNASDISADGSVVIGSVVNRSSEEGSVWKNGARISLALGGQPAMPTGISDDGAVMVGGYNSPEGYQAFLLNETGTYVGLGFLPDYTAHSVAEAVSGNGTVVVGYSYAASGSQAFRWTVGTGMKSLGTLAGAQSTVAVGASFDGSVLIGDGTSPSGYNQAFRWTDSAGIIGLGVLPGDQWSSAKGISGDGRIIVGNSWSSGSSSNAFIWLDGEGLRNLADFIREKYGVETGPLGWVSSISARGDAIVGYNSTGNWLISGLPTPSGPPALSIQPAGRRHTSNASATQQVQVISTGPWIASSSQAWVTLTSSGPGTITYEVSENIEYTDRMGTISMKSGTDSLTFIVFQAGAPLLTITPEARDHTSDAVTQSFSVKSNQPWIVESDQPWITFPGLTSGSGNRSVSYRLDANPEKNSRSGTIVVVMGNVMKVFRLSQSGAPDFLEIYPASRSHDSSAATEQIVSTGANVAWAATADQSWITITGGSPGSGNSAFTYSLSANPALTSRSGSITVTGAGITRTYMITQAASTELLTVEPDSRAHSNVSAQNQSIGISSNIHWSAASDQHWITLAGDASGTGNGLLKYNIQANPTAGERSGNIVVTGNGIAITLVRTISISQAAGLRSLTIAPASASHPAEAASAQSIAVSSNVPWGASTSHPWIALNTGEAGVGNGTISYSVSENNTGASRAGSIAITSGDITRIFAISQDAKQNRLTISPASRNHTSDESGEQSFAIASNVSWSAVSGQAWLTLISGASGGGDGLIKYSVSKNLTDSTRSAAITIEGGGMSRSFNVYQAAKPPEENAPAYQVTVNCDLREAPLGMPIPLYGQATLSTGGPAVAVLVEIHVFKSGQSRRLQAITDGFGRFTTVFHPLPLEGGDYEVAASAPQVTPLQSSSQASFALLGFYVGERSLEASLIPNGDSGSIDFTLVNPGSANISGLSYELIGAPAGVSASIRVNDAPLGGVTLFADGNLTAKLTLNASGDNLPRQGGFKLQIRSSGAEEAIVQINYQARRLLADFRVEPNPLDLGIVRGRINSFEINLLNTGLSPSDPVQIILPAIEWLSLATKAPLSPLAPGSRTTFTLVAAPGSSAALGDYATSVIVYDGRSRTEVPLTLKVVSNATGGIRIDPVSELTFYVEGAPRVDKPKLSLRNVQNGQLIPSEAIAFSGGVFEAGVLAEGWYDVTITAPNHSTFTSKVQVRPGHTTQVEAFMSRQVVKYSFRVQEVGLEDRTRVVVDTIFETNVPIPVVTVEPRFIDLSDVPQGDSKQIDIKINNHGTIAVQNFSLSSGQYEGWNISIPSSFIGTVPAKSEIIVPVTFSRRTASAGLRSVSGKSWDTWENGPGFGPFPDPVGEPVVDCAFFLFASYEWVCGNRPLSYGEVVYGTFSNCAISFSRAFAGIFGGGGGGSGGKISAWGSGSSSQGQGTNTEEGEQPDSPIPPLFFLPPDYTPARPFFCDCLPPGTPKSISIAKDVTQIWGGVTDVLEGKPYPYSSVDEGLRIAGYIPNPYVKAGVFLACMARRDSNLQSKAINETEASSLREQVEMYHELNRFYYDFGKELFGSEAWFIDSEDQIKPALLEKFWLMISPQGTSGTIVSASELEEIKQMPRPADISLYDVELLVERWNNTINRVASVNVIDTAKLRQALSGLDLADEIAEDDGFTSPLEGFEFHFSNFLYQLSGNNGVCAKVKVRIEQEVIVTRRAFRAFLEIENTSDNPLTNLQSLLRIRDEQGAEAVGLFSIEVESDDEITSVAPGESVTIQWLIIPSDAAGSAAQNVYFVDGSLSLNSGDGPVTLPFSPEQIVVFPNAKIHLTYFLQRDVLGDDPFTDAVEPSVPFPLAVLVENVGRGDAEAVRIDSMQPEIVENEKGLYVGDGFRIVSAALNGDAVNNAMSINFGRIPSGEKGVGVWNMTFPLQGIFTSLKSEFTYLSNWGNFEVGLVSDVRIKKMIRMVSAAGALEDSLPDFLVDDDNDLSSRPDRIYFSGGGSAPVATVASGTFAGLPTVGAPLVLTVTAKAGWTYVHLADPSAGALRLSRVVREDGTELPPANFWQTDRTFIGLQQRPVLEHKLHILDSQLVPQYQLVFEALPPPDDGTALPESRIDTLPASSPPVFPVSWSSDRPELVANYSIYYRENGGAAHLWLQSTTRTNALFQGTVGSTYEFYSVSHYKNGLTEAASAATKPSTKIMPKSTAIVSLEGLSRVYTGSAQAVSATTSPAGLKVNITYDGRDTAPTLAGLYEVSAAVDDPNYTGTAGATLVIARASATVLLGDLTQSYTGRALAPSVTTTPPGLDVTMVYAGGAPVGVGSHTVKASISDANYTGSTEGILEVTKAAQSISFVAPVGKRYGDPAFVPDAKISSGLVPTFTVLSGPAAFMGDKLLLTGAGVVTVKASHTGDDNYEAATSVERSFTVAKAAQSITFLALADRIVSEKTVQLAASSSSGLPVSLAVVSGPAVVSGSTLTLSGAGSVVLRASQVGNADFEPAPSVERTFNTVAKSSIRLTSIKAIYDGLPRPAMAETVPAGLTVEYSYRQGKLPATSDAPKHAGTYTVTATTKDPRLSPAIKATGTIVIAKAPLTATATNKRKFAGQPNPALTFDYSGFVSGEGPAAVKLGPVISTTARQTSPGGIYPIRLSGGSAADYAFRYVNGSLRVESFSARYEALLEASVDGRPVAKLELTVATSGTAWTGLLTLPTESAPISLKGVLTTDTVAEVATLATTVVRGANSYMVAAALTLGGDCSATLTLNGLPYAHSSEGRRLLVAKEKLGWSGAHTLSLSAAEILDEDTRAFPRGAAFATAVINSKGNLKLAGYLADGTKLTATLAADEDGCYRLYAQPYSKRTHSFFIGRLKLQDHPTLTSRRFLSAGAKTGLLWQKAAAASDKSYRTGFGPVRSTAILDPWIPPAKATKSVASVTLAERLGLGSPPVFAGLDIFVGGGASITPAQIASLPSAVQIAPNDKFVIQGSNPANLAFSTTPSTGTFSGSFVITEPIIPPASKPAKRSVPFSGILRQGPSGDRQTIGAGSFQIPPLVKGGETGSGLILLRNRDTPEDTVR